MLQTVSMMLGGHAAIRLIENDVYTGAQSDLKRATEVIRTMIMKLGMSDEMGLIYLGNEEEIFVGMEFGKSREFSEEYATRIDRIVSDTLKGCYQVAVDTLKQNIGKLHGLASLLMDRETINRDEFVSFMDGTAAAIQPAHP